MKKIQKILQSMLFDEAKFLVKQDFATNLDIKSSDEKPFSKGIKLFCIYLFCLFSSLLPMKNSIGVTIFLIFLNTVSFFVYFKIKFEKEYLKNASYSLSIYLMSQITIMSIFLGIRENSHKLFGSYYTLFALLYILLTFLLSFKRCEYIILDYLSKKGVAIDLRRVTHMWNKISFKLTVGILLAIILGMQFFRLNKWWLNHNSNSVGKIVVTNQWLGLLLLIGIILIIMVLLVSITMIPTLLFNVSDITDGMLLNKYSEEFRKEYDFTKEEWYGEE